MKKLIKLAKHTSSVMNKWQLSVPTVQKLEHPKSKGIGDAIEQALLHNEESRNPVPNETIANARKRRKVNLEEEELIFLQTAEVPHVKEINKVVIVEFAGLQFKECASQAKNSLKLFKATYLNHS